ncbi:hypothetical protein C0J26_11885 [Pseudomonas baetica]|nr:hypothetical protein C0J26_11885 [Pseudomonas baetica]
MVNGQSPKPGHLLDYRFVLHALRLFQSPPTCTSERRILLFAALSFIKPVSQYSEATMTTSGKTEEPCKKAVREELTFLDVRQAARDGQKVFRKFVITGRLP